MGVPWGSQHPLRAVARVARASRRFECVSYPSSPLGRNLGPGWRRGFCFNPERFCSWKFMNRPACSRSSSQLIPSPGSPTSSAPRPGIHTPLGILDAVSLPPSPRSSAGVCAREAGRSCSSKCLRFHFPLQRPAWPLLSSSCCQVTNHILY